MLQNQKHCWNCLFKSRQRPSYKLGEESRTSPRSTNLFRTTFFLLLFCGMVYVFFTFALHGRSSGDLNCVQLYPMQHKRRNTKVSKVDHKSNLLNKNSSLPKLEELTFAKKTNIKSAYKKMLQLRDFKRNYFIPEGGDKKILTNLLSLQDTLLIELERMVDEEIKENDEELNYLRDVVQQRIVELQNPARCDTARKLFCVVKTNCGLGCSLHHYATCLFIALGTNRTMILDFSTSSDYAGMKEIFQPVSGTCDTSGPAYNVVEWEGEGSDHPTPHDVSAVKVVIYALRDRHTLLRGHTVPEGIMKALDRLHASPNDWWIGQVMRYLTRLKPSVTNRIEKVKVVINYTHPVVGIHIRRTDKKKEASYHNVEEYMNCVTKWYDRYDKKMRNKSTRRVYLATDEPSLLKEITKKYPAYVFLHDPLLAQTPSLSKRFAQGLQGIVQDVAVLSECDFFVGTFSSNVGRLVYELMQSQGERTFDSYSLDDSYFFTGRGEQKFQKAIESHTPQPGEIELQVGDQIASRSRPYFSDEGMGKNLRTEKEGKYPLHKVVDFLISAPYPGIS